MSRLHRREIVWKNEALLGREKYAQMQKQDALYMFLLCVRHVPLYGADYRKMRQEILARKNILWQAFTGKDKLLYALGMYLPFAYLAFVKARDLLSKPHTK